MKTNHAGRGWKYVPQPDITTWELAQAMKAFINAAIIEKLPPEVQRHFKWEEGEKKKWVKVPSD